MFRTWVVLFGSLLAFSCGGERPLRFSVLLENQGRVKPGCVVAYEGLEIGRVVSIDQTPGKISVEIEVPPESRSRLYREAQFWIVTDGFVDFCLAMQDREGTRTELEDGDVIDMRPGWFDRLSDQLRQAEDSARSALEQLTTGVAEAVDSFQKSPEFEAFKEQLAEAGRDAATVAKTRYRRFVDQDLPKLEEKASAYRDKLRKEGRNEEAEIFWKWFRRWADAVKGVGREEEPAKAEEEPGD